MTILSYRSSLPVVHFEENSPANVEISISKLGIALPLVGKIVDLLRDRTEHASLNNGKFKKGMIYGG